MQTARRNFLKSDTILLTTNTNIQFTISNFRSVVVLHYGMFGPVAVSDCKLLPEFTINDNQNSDRLIKYYGKLASEKKVQRISPRDPSYKAAIAKYNINEKLLDSIVHEISAKLHEAGSATNLGLEISETGIYNIRQYKKEYGEVEIIKINLKTNVLSKVLKNYPIENEY